MTPYAAPATFPFRNHRTMAQVMASEAAIEAAQHDIANGVRRATAARSNPNAILFAMPCSRCGKRTNCAHRSLK